MVDGSSCHHPSDLTAASQGRPARTPPCRCARLHEQHRMPACGCVGRWDSRLSTIESQAFNLSGRKRLFFDGRWRCRSVAWARPHEDRGSGHQFASDVHRQHAKRTRHFGRVFRRLLCRRFRKPGNRFAECHAWSSALKGINSSRAGTGLPGAAIGPENARFTGGGRGIDCKRHDEWSVERTSMTLKSIASASDNLNPHCASRAYPDRPDCTSRVPRWPS